MDRPPRKPRPRRTAGGGHFAAGLAAHRAGDLAQAAARYRDALRECPDHFDALHMSGVVALQTGDAARAVEVIGRALRLDPRSATALNNLGSALLVLRRHDEAADAFRRAIAVEPRFGDALHNLGNALGIVGRAREAVDAFDRAIDAGVVTATTLTRRGAMRHRLGLLEQALEDHDRALAIAPDDPESTYNRAIALHAMQRAPEAVLAYSKVLASAPDTVTALVGRAAMLHSCGRHEEALADLERAHLLEPGHESLRGMRLLARRRLHQWDGDASASTELVAALERGELAASPFVCMLLLDSPALQLSLTRAWVRRHHPARADGPLPARRDPGGRIKLAYFSSDFRSHAVANLLAELIELHDRSRFEVIAFAFGPATADPMRQRLMAGFDRFLDVRSMSDEQVVALARSLDIDIAVDLNGLTENARCGLFAQRVATTQVGYLGYLGTLGADHLEYLIADRVLVPDASRVHCAERVVRLPRSYQVNDRRRPIAAATPTREALGLPADGVVFCAFTSAYKVSPSTFGSWMRILAAVEGSVLWLLDDGPRPKANLRMEAEARGIAASRLVFAPKAPLAEHLARQRVADLYLDTLPCNAGTTASDALWAGLPVLTQAGEGIAARVAASLLHAVDLPELVTGTAAEYEALAIALARDPARRARLREHLTRDPTRLPLFDTPRFARGLEAAFERMHARARAGLPPEAFDVET